MCSSLYIADILNLSMCWFELKIPLTSCHPVFLLHHILPLANSKITELVLNISTSQPPTINTSTFLMSQRFSLVSFFVMPLLGLISIRDPILITIKVHGLSLLIPVFRTLIHTLKYFSNCLLKPKLILRLHYLQVFSGFSQFLTSNQTA